MDKFSLVLPIISHIVALLYLQKQKYNKWITAGFLLAFAIAAICLPLFLTEPLHLFLALLAIQFAVFCIMATGSIGEKFFLLVTYANSFSICIGFNLILSTYLTPSLFLAVCQSLIVILMHGFLYHVQIYKFQKVKQHITSGWWKISVILLLFLIQFLNQYAFKITSHESASDLLFDFIVFSCIFYATQLFIFESIDKVSEKNRQIYENTLLKELMNKDELTNLQNRSAYVRYVEVQKQNPLSDSRKSFIFVMLDIDNFKKINDLQGHAAGDKALQIVGSKIKAYFSPLNCQSFRFGGDEFALLLEDITLEEAQEHIDIFTEDLFRTTQLSLSYGCAAVDFQNENPFEAAYQKADAIMYGYKHQKKTTV